MALLYGRFAYNVSMGVSITVVAAWHILDDDEVNTIHHMKNDDYLRRESFLTGEKQGPISHSHFSLSREKKNIYFNLLFNIPEILPGAIHQACSSVWSCVC